jgi:hypothetical protein
VHEETLQGAQTSESFKDSRRTSSEGIALYVRKALQVAQKLKNPLWVRKEKKSSGRTTFLYVQEAQEEKQEETEKDLDREDLRPEEAQEERTGGRDREIGRRNPAQREGAQVKQRSAEGRRSEPLDRV